MVGLFRWAPQISPRWIPVHIVQVGWTPRPSLSKRPEIDHCTKPLQGCFVDFVQKMEGLAEPF
jgi:hypothetical protein